MLSQPETLDSDGLASIAGAFAGLKAEGDICAEQRHARTAWSDDRPAVVGLVGSHARALSNFGPSGTHAVRAKPCSQTCPKLRRSEVVSGYVLGRKWLNQAKRPCPTQPLVVRGPGFESPISCNHAAASALKNGQSDVKWWSWVPPSSTVMSWRGSSNT